MQDDDGTTAAELGLLLQQIGVLVSPRTILKGRRALGWTYHSSAYCQLTRPVNEEKRLQWAREYRDNNFENVVWTDETSVQLETHKCFYCHKLRQKPRYKPRPKHPVKVHVWAGISWNGHTDICIFKCIMNAELYVRILGECLVPFLESVYPNGHRFMQDMT